MKSFNINSADGVEPEDMDKIVKEIEGGKEVTLKIEVGERKIEKRIGTDGTGSFDRPKIVKEVMNTIGSAVSELIIF